MKSGEKLRDMSGAALALTSLAVLGAAAVVSTPVWIWYRRKRKRTDSLVESPPPGVPAVQGRTEDTPQAASHVPATSSSPPETPADRTD